MPNVSPRRRTAAARENLLRRLFGADSLRSDNAQRLPTPHCGGLWSAGQRGSTVSVRTKPRCLVTAAVT
jgi:hypothetical protein